MAALTEQAVYPWAWWWRAWRVWHTSLCPQTIPRDKLLMPPGGQAQQCFGNAVLWRVSLDRPHEPNAGMAPCEWEVLSTFGISGSLEAAIKRNVQVSFRVWHFMKCSLLTFTFDLPQQCPDGIDEAFWRLQPMAMLSLPPWLPIVWVEPCLR